MNDAATNYYTDMSDMQKRIHEKECSVLDIKMKVLEAEYKTQQLKQLYYEKWIAKADRANVLDKENESVLNSSEEK